MKSFSFFHLSLFFFSIFCFLTLPIDAVQRSKEKKENSRLIVIDPGHGGKNIGTYSHNKKYKEKHLTLATALIVKKTLEKKGYRVHITRKNDIYLSLDERIQRANRKKADVFVSIHYNSAPNKLAHGIEIFYYRSRHRRKRLRSIRLAKKILGQMVNSTQAKSRGVKYATFMVIRKADMPAVLVEGGFMSNSQEMKKLRKVSYLNKLALAIAEGVDRYIKVTYKEKP